MSHINSKEVTEYIIGMHGKGVKIGLSNMHELMSALGNPHTNFKMVHVAGTNGKGSTCAYLDSILRTAGYSVGLYTSPFLQVFNERIRVNGECIPDDALGELGTHLKETADRLLERGIKPTFFELCTALAFMYFAQSGVDIAVIETGLGGRLDPTNIIQPELTVITRIGYDHMSVLGDTLEKIAYEKAGIIKRGVPCVLYPQPPSIRKVFEDVCLERGSPFLALAEDDVSITEVSMRSVRFSLSSQAFEISIPGKHQAYNAACACIATKQLGISDADIASGLKSTRWPGRLEWMGNFLLDGAHNEQGARSLVEFIKSQTDKRQLMISGIVKDKPYEEMAKLFSEIASEVITVAPDSHRALEANALAGVFEKEGIRASIAASVPEAIRTARERTDGTIIISGSLYLVGEARTLLEKECL